MRLVRDEPVMEAEMESVPDADGPVQDAAEEAGSDQGLHLVSEDVDTRLLEALLLATHHPLTAGRIAELMDLPATKPVRQAIKDLNVQYEESHRAFRVEQVAGGYQILTLPEFGEQLKKLHQREIDAKLTKAALETLAIIAYKQPILRRHRGDPRRCLRRDHSQFDGKAAGEHRGTGGGAGTAHSLRDDQAVPGGFWPEHAEGFAAVGRIAHAEGRTRLGRSYLIRQTLWKLPATPRSRIGHPRRSLAVSWAGLPPTTHTRL